MKILLSGARGLIGSATRASLQERGHDVYRLVRSRESLTPGDVYWNPAAKEIDVAALEGFEAIVHLAGENIASGRWTTAKKKEIVNSRVDGTRILSEAIAKLTRKPGVFVSASAIGFYGNRSDELLDEESPKGEGFLPDVCAAWERATYPAKQAGVRTVNLRIGIILSPDGGALAKMLVPFRMGAGGRIGSGKQLMSWISLEEMVRVIEFALTTPALHGPVNAVSPTPITNSDFTRALGKAVKRPTVAPLPAFMAKLLMGEMAEELLLASIRVTPKKLIDQGYEFMHADLSTTLTGMLENNRANEQNFRTDTWLPVPRKDAFGFFCDPGNLERITPPWLQFKIDSQSTEGIEEGTEFTYQLKIRGITVRWKSRIEQWNPETEFADTQLSGPYKKWYHKHRFFERAGGTLMTDDVDYRVPGGLLGKCLIGPFVRRDVEKIFNYRQETIAKHFAPSGGAA